MVSAKLPNFPTPKHWTSTVVTQARPPLVPSRIFIKRAGYREALAAMGVPLQATEINRRMCGRDAVKVPPPKKKDK